jgi:TorA maturation chaperone TorD
MEDFLSHEERRRDSYKLLSECYYPPDEQLVQMLNGLKKSRGRSCSEIIGNIPGLIDTDSLRIDYSKLFMGPYGLLAPPYGSIYLEDSTRLMTDSTMDVRDRYREEGLDIDLKEAPDHIAIELEFMYFLVFREVEAIRDSDSGNVAVYLEKQKVFLENHLGKWVTIFTDRVEANAQTYFYKNLAHTTKSVVKNDLESLFGNSVLALVEMRL